MEHTPKVSVITPLYNAARFIVQTIESVQGQSHSHWEMIIIDDASTDDSLKIVRSLAEKDARIKVYSLSENRGAAYSRNYATELASGQFIAFLDSDDYWHPAKLERQLDFMISRDREVSFTSYLHVDEEGKTFLRRIKAMPELSYKKQHRNNYIGNLTGMYNVEKLGKIEAPGIRKRQDWAVWLEAIERSGKPAVGLQDDLAYYRVRKGSISSKKMGLVGYNFKFYRNYLKHSRVASAYYLMIFFIEYFFIRPKYIQKL